jgi:hypothetical protein
MDSVIKKLLALFSGQRDESIRPWFPDRLIPCSEQSGENPLPDGDNNPQRKDGEQKQERVQTHEESEIQQLQL